MADLEDLAQLELDIDINELRERAAQEGRTTPEPEPSISEATAIANEVEAPPSFLDPSSLPPLLDEEPTSSVAVQEEDEGFLASTYQGAKNFAAGLFSGAVQEAGTQLDNPFIDTGGLSQEAVEGLTDDSLSSAVGSGFGQAAVRTGTIGAYAAAGAALGAPIGGVGAIPGSIAGTIFGGLMTMFQGTRSELEQVEQRVRDTSDATGAELDAQIDTARDRALAPILVGQGLDSTLGILTGGSAGVIRKGVAATAVAGVKAGKAAGGGVKGFGKGVRSGIEDAAQQLESAAIKRAQDEAKRHLTRAGKIKGVLLSGAGEAVGENLSQAGQIAAVESAVAGEDLGGFASRLPAAVVSEEALRAGLVGGIVGTGVRGAGELIGSARSKRRDDQNEGVQIVSELLGNKLSDLSARALFIQRQVARLEDPHNGVESIEIADHIATREELERIAKSGVPIDLGPTPTETGNTIRLKAARLAEIEQQAELIRKADKADKKIKQTQRSIDIQLDRAGDPKRDISSEVVGRGRTEKGAEVFSERKDTEILATAEITEQRLQQQLEQRAALLEAEKRAGVDSLGRAERASLVQEEEGLQQFFAQRAEEAEQKLAGIEEQQSAQAEQDRQNRIQRLALFRSILNKSRAFKKRSLSEQALLLKKGEQLDRQVDILQRDLDDAQKQLGAVGTDATVDVLLPLSKRASEAEIKLRSAKAERAILGKETAIDVFTTEEQAAILEAAFEVDQKRRRGLLAAEQDASTDPRTEEEIQAEVNSSSVSGSKNNTKPKNSIAAVYNTVSKAVLPTAVQDGVSFSKILRGLNLDAGLTELSDRQQVYYSRIEAQQERNELEKKMEIDLKRLDRAVKQHLGLKSIQKRDIIRKPGRVIAAFTPSNIRKYNEMMRQVSGYLKGDLSLTSLPKRVRPAAKKMRDNVDDLSTRLQLDGIVEGPLVAKIEAGKGTYLNRSYKKFRVPNWADLVDEKVQRRFISFLRNALAPQRNNVHHKNKSDEEWEDHLHAQMRTLLVDNAGSPMHFLSNTRLDREVKKILLRRKDIPEELRALWGEDDNGVVQYANTVHQMINLITARKHLENVREIGMGSFLFKPEDRRGDFVHQISDANSKTLQPLAGLYTSKEVLDELNRVYSPEVASAGWKFYYKINGVAKFGSTVLSTITQTRNFLSNFFILARNGNLGPKGLASMPDSMKVAFSDLLPSYLLNPKNEESNERFELYTRLVRLGVIDDAVTIGEYEAVLRDAFGDNVGLDKYKEIQVSNAIEATKAAVSAGAHTAVDFSTRLYRASDSFAKTAGFFAERQKYQKAMPHLSPAELDQKAAEIVRNTMPTYSLTPAMVQWSRRNPFFGPFVSFASETIRNEMHTLKLIKQEYKDPATKGIAINRLLSWGITSVASRTGLVMLGRHLTGTDGEDEDAVRTLAAPWDKNSSLVFIGKDKNGNSRYYNISHTLPDSQIADPVTAGYLKWMDDEGGYEIFKAFMTEFASPFMSPELVAQRVLDAWRGQRSDGVAIYDKRADSDRERIWKAMTYVLDGVSPGVIKQAQKVYLGLQGEPTRSGQPLNPGDEFLASVTGQRITTLDHKRALSFRSNEFNKGLREATNSFNRVIGSKQSVSDAEIRDSYRKLLGNRERMFKQLNKEYYATIRLGATPEEAEAIMIDEGRVGKANAFAAIDGITEPFTLSESKLDKIYEIPGRLEQLERALGEDFDYMFPRRKSIPRG